MSDGAPRRTRAPPAEPRDRKPCPGGAGFSSYRATPPKGPGWPAGSPALPQLLDEEETAEADRDEDAADQPHEKERAKQRRVSLRCSARSARDKLFPVRGVPGVEVGVVDASERPVLAESRHWRRQAASAGSRRARDSRRTPKAIRATRTASDAVISANAYSDRRT